MGGSFAMLCKVFFRFENFMRQMQARGPYPFADLVLLDALPGTELFF